MRVLQRALQRWRLQAGKRQKLVRSEDYPVHSKSQELVSIVVLNYNNKDVVRQCVGRVLELRWTALEVIVIDNASTDGAPEMLEREFGSKIRLIRRKQNSPTAGRNEGFWLASGRFILSLDNDIILVDRDVIERAVAVFEKNASAAALAFKIASAEDVSEPLSVHWWHPVPMVAGKNRFFWTDFFPEGAVFFRKEELQKAGGYDEVLFQYFEQVDLSYKFLRQGSKIMYCPSLRCFEIRFEGNIRRKKARVNYLSIRNRLWIAWKYYPIMKAIPYVGGRMIAGFIRCFRDRSMTSYMRAIKDGLFAPQAIRAQRDVLGRSVWRQIEELHHGLYCDQDAGTKNSAFVAGESATV